MTSAGETTSQDERVRLLGIYLNDHLAGATAGVDLAQRVAAANRGSEHGPELTRVADEIGADRDELTSIMRALDQRVRQYKVVLAWAAEKAARFKSNGHLLSRSPLSTLVELEGLAIGIRGKIAGWRTLTTVADRDTRVSRARLETLIARAERQLESVEASRVDTAADLFGRE